MQNNLDAKRILEYDDLVAIANGSSAEPLTDVKTYDDRIISQYNKYDMLPYTGETILVRDTVAKMLAQASRTLVKQGYRLKVVYGYRHPNVQQAYFERRKQELRIQQPELVDETLERFTHNFVAVPSVAGHPVGGAVDLTIVTMNGGKIDMGTEIADYGDAAKVQTFTTNITPLQAINRALLHNAMVAQGFAPFYGEWWHFSYGDREWAAFYNEKMALYGAVDI